MTPFKLAVITCVWQRPEITEIFFDSLLLQMHDVNASWRVFCAGPEDQRIERPGVEYLDHPNQPLGRKFNESLWHARTWSPDAVLVMGSDDLMTASLINAEIEAVKDGRDIVGCLDAFFLNAKTGESIHWPGYEGKKEPVGSARMYGKSILEKAHWHLWEDQKTRGLDGSANVNCNDLGASWLGFRMRIPDWVFLGIKGEPMLNSWEELKKPSEPVETETYLLNSFGPKIAGKILALGGK